MHGEHCSQCLCRDPHLDSQSPWEYIPICTQNKLQAGAWVWARYQLQLQISTKPLAVPASSLWRSRPHANDVLAALHGCGVSGRPQRRESDQSTRPWNTIFSSDNTESVFAVPANMAAGCHRLDYHQNTVEIVIVDHKSRHVFRFHGFWWRVHANHCKPHDICTYLYHLSPAFSTLEAELITALAFKFQFTEWPASKIKINESMSRNDWKIMRIQHIITLYLKSKSTEPTEPLFCLSPTGLALTFRQEY